MQDIDDEWDTSYSHVTVKVNIRKKVGDVDGDDDSVQELLYQNKDDSN